MHFTLRLRRNMTLIKASIKVLDLKSIGKWNLPKQKILSPQTYKLITWLSEIIGDSLSSSLSHSCCAKIAIQFIYFFDSLFGLQERKKKRWKDISNESKNVYLHLIPHRVSQSDYLKSHKMKKYWQLKNKWTLGDLNSTWLNMTLWHQACDEVETIRFINKQPQSTSSCLQDLFNH